MINGNYLKSRTHFPKYSGENSMKKSKRFKSYESLKSWFRFSSEIPYMKKSNVPH